MDEPTSGLDPLAVRRFDDLLREEKRRGTTVLMSSHVLSEVRRVCDRVGILREGRLARTEAIGSLLRRSGKRVRLRVAGALDAGALDAAGVHDLDVHAAAEDGDESGFVWVGSRAETEATFTYTGDVNDLLDRLAGYDLLDLEVTEAPLEEVFMRFYGGEE